MNVLITNSSSIYGGGEYFTEKLALELKNRGYRVAVCSRDNGLLCKKLQAAGVDIFNVAFPERGTGNLWKNVKSLKSIIIKYNFDIIHSNTGYDRTASAFASRGTKAKHITNCHSLESISHNLTHYIRNRYLTQHFIADGDSIRDRIIKENNIPENKISVVYNGIEPGGMSRDNELRNKIRRELNVNENEIVIGSVGRLVNFKGYKYLLSAFRIISEKISNTKLIIVGDGELKDSLINQARVLNINDKVVFTGFRDDLQAVYSAFDIYVNSSIGGGGELFPFTILYAMAQSLPVVAARVGDIPTMINDGVNGFLVEEKSPFRISDKVVQLIKNQEISSKFGENGLLKLEKEFNLKKMVDKIEEIYQKV